VLVNNVGEFGLSPIAAMSYVEWRKILGSNLDSAFLMSSLALPGMRQRGYGRIINIGLGPVHLVRAAPNIAAYAVAKTGVVVLTLSLAAEEAPYGITVNCVSPGLIDNGHLPPEQAQWMHKRVPMGRLGRAEEVARAVAFLVSDEASYVSGANLTVSGGWDWFNRPVDHDGDVTGLFLETTGGEQS
jgi:3-oxoacyl-[acyl-carrier protein] reductase